MKSPKGVATRPTGSRVKQTLFDVVAAAIPGCRFLDVFAGNGGIGLEALSRGAARVVLVEASAASAAAIRDNVAALGSLGGDVQVLRQDARVALAGLADQGWHFDVVYLDPPYESDLYEGLLELVGSRRLLDRAGVLVAEHFHKRVLPETIGGLCRRRTVRVGDHQLSFYRWEEGDEAR